MSDEVTGATISDGGVDVGGEAPDISDAGQAGTEAPGAESVEVAVQENVFDPPEYAWAEWDGSANDDIPQFYQPAVSRFQEIINERTASHESALEEMRAQLAALESGDPDPRIGHLTSQLNERNVGYSEMEARLAALTEQHEAMQAQYDALLQEQIIADIEALPPELMALMEDDKVLSTTEQLMQNGAADSIESALRMAAARHQVQLQADVRPASKITPGGNGPPGVNGGPKRQRGSMAATAMQYLQRA